MPPKTSQRGERAGQPGPPEPPQDAPDAEAAARAAGAHGTADATTAVEAKAWARAQAWARAEVARSTEPAETTEPAEATSAETAAAADDVTGAQAAGTAATADDAGEAVSAPDAGEAVSAPDAAGPAAGAGRRGLRVPVLLALATVLLGGFGIFATVRAHDLRSNASAQNLALTSPESSAVKRQVDAAITTIFSYRYNDTAATSRAAQSLLTGPAIRQYNRLFSLVERQAPAEKLVVTTTVTNSAVEFLTGGRARVLVFANQQDSRAGTSQASYAGTMFAVTAVHSGGHWKIENIDTFTG